MFLHDQLNGSFTWAEFFLALLISVAPLAATLLVKVLLYRRRRAEGEDGLLAAEADCIADTDADREGVAHLRRDAVNERGVRRSIANKEEGNPAMKNRNIIMTAADHAELGHAIAFAGEPSGRARASWKGLKGRIGARGDRRAGGDPGRRDHHEQPGQVTRLGHRRAQGFHARFPERCQPQGPNGLRARAAGHCHARPPRG